MDKAVPQRKTIYLMVGFHDEACPVIERITINAILWNPYADTFLCLDWIKFGWKTFVIGGVEEGENLQEAAEREIAEETGYRDIELVANLGALRSGYYAAHKKENRVAHTTGFLFRLKSARQSAVKNTVNLPHIFQWVPRSEVSSFLTPSSQKYLWDQAKTHLS
jgi:hypothetical protein